MYDTCGRADAILYDAKVVSRSFLEFRGYTSPSPSVFQFVPSLTQATDGVKTISETFKIHLQLAFAKSSANSDCDLV